MNCWKSLLTVLILLWGCAAEKTPNQIYTESNSRVINGMTFSDEKTYYTQRKQDEVESRFPQYMKKMGKTRAEVIDFYSRFSRELAKCKALSLVRETINGSTAELEYAQKDICGNESNTSEKQVIRMIFEDGWKIDDVEISV